VTPLTDSEVQFHCETSATKMKSLRQLVQSYGSALVAFSGGVDSTFVLKVAQQELGRNVWALTALSASVSADEAQEARALAAEIGSQHRVEQSNELHDDRYAANPTNRCYFCKTELYGITARIQAELKLNVVLDGFNFDDKKDVRPGHKAAQEHQVISPLALCELTKNEIRAWSKTLGLSTWNKPQMACLASRLPYGTQVTVQRLNQVGNAEKALRALGLIEFRVRYHDTVARLEVSQEELTKLSDFEFRKKVSLAVKAAGFTFVAIDLEPFKSGRMNEGVKLNVLGARP
jgi:pyridinium-3,5-biscarboxylic acid mononucleotide sulfurtransferase